LAFKKERLTFIPDKEQLVDASFFIMLTLPTTIKDLSTSMKKALYDSIVHVEEEDFYSHWLWNLTMAKQGKRKTLVT